MSYRFRKVDGVWQRRDDDESDPRWKTLKVSKVVDHTRKKFTTRQGVAVMEPVYRNEWTWVRRR